MENADLSGAHAHASPKAVPTVSVICPVFESEEFLPDCLRSLLNQTSRDFEIVVVDDCSPGECEAIVNDFRSSGRPIRYVRNERNRGTLFCRFEGARASSGEYVMFLDSDDMAEPNFIETLHQLIVDTGADFAGSARLADKAGAFVLEGPERIFQALAEGEIPNWNVWTKIYRRSTFLTLDRLIAFSEVHRVICPEDAPINLFYAMKSTSYAHTPSILVKYNNDRPENTTNSITPGSICSKLSMRMEVFNLLNEAFPEHENAVNSAVSRLAANLYRRSLKRARIQDAEDAITQLLGYDDAAIPLAAMLRAAERDRRTSARLWRENVRKLRDMLKEW